MKKKEANQARHKRAKPETVLEAAVLEAPELTESELQGEIVEALTGPMIAPERVTVGGREWPITYLPWGVEQVLVTRLSPYVRVLTSHWARGEEAFTDALAVSIAGAGKDLGPMCVAILAHHDKSIDEAWLNEHAHLAELLELLVAQLVKNKTADRLGKLWGRGVLSARVAEALGITGSRVMPNSMRQ